MRTLDYVVLTLWALVIAGACGVYWWRFKRRRIYHTIVLIGHWSDMIDVTHALEDYEDRGLGFREIELVSSGFYDSMSQYSKYQVEELSLKGFMKKVQDLQEKYTFTIADPSTSLPSNE